VNDLPDVYVAIRRDNISGRKPQMSHINYNHLYYFWHVYKEGSVVGAAEALYLTPQTITGQIKALEERLQGKLFKRKGRGIEPSELGNWYFATPIRCSP
jgi:Transcriptional regulator